MLSWLTYIGFRIEVWVRFRKVRNVLIGKRKKWISGEKDIDKREEERKESLVEVSQTFLSTLIKKF